MADWRKPMMTYVWQIVGGIVCVAVISVGIGLTAPHWPTRWLDRDRGPLHLTRWDTKHNWERVGVRWWKRHFPDGGDWAGGETKSRLPDLSDPHAIDRYIVETRRAEWVHWLADLSVIPIAFFATWWIFLAFCVITFIVNSIAIMIVRYNRLRLYEVAQSAE